MSYNTIILSNEIIDKIKNIKEPNYDDFLKNVNNMMNYARNDNLTIFETSIIENIFRQLKNKSSVEININYYKILLFDKLCKHFNYILSDLYNNFYEKLRKDLITTDNIIENIDILLKEVNIEHVINKYKNEIKQFCEFIVYMNYLIKKYNFYSPEVLKYCDKILKSGEIIDIIDNNIYKFYQLIDGETAAYDIDRQNSQIFLHVTDDNKNIICDDWIKLTDEDINYCDKQLEITYNELFDTITSYKIKNENFINPLLKLVNKKINKF